MSDRPTQIQASDAPTGRPATEPAGPDAPPPADRPEAPRVLVPALIMVVVVGAAAAGAGLLVPSTGLDDTGRTVVRVAGLVVAAGGLLLLVGPWRSAAWAGMDALPPVLAVAGGVIALLALLSIPTSPISVESEDGSGDSVGEDTGDGSGSGGGIGDGDGDRSGDGLGDGSSSGGSDRVVVDRRLVVGDVYLRALDVNGDGIVTLSELDGGDGRITVAELDDASGNVRVSGYDLGDLDADDFDVDGDQVVDLSVLDRDGDGVVEMRDLDSDGDGVVMLDEVDRDRDARLGEWEETDRRREERPAGGADAPIERDDEPSDDDDDSQVLAGVLRALLIAALVVAAVAGLAWARSLGPWRRRSPMLPAPELPPDEDPPVDADAAQAGLSASLATASAGDDPRAAIVDAYLRLLDVLAEAGGARRLQEAPHEHLHRVLGPLGVRPEPTHQLAELFVMARFSPHPITEHHRDQAVALLHTALADLHTRLAALQAEGSGPADGTDGAAGGREPSHAG